MLQPVELGCHQTSDVRSIRSCNSAEEAARKKILRRPLIWVTTSVIALGQSVLLRSAGANPCHLLQQRRELCLEGSAAFSTSPTHRKHFGAVYVLAVVCMLGLISAGTAFVSGMQDPLHLRLLAKIGQPRRTKGFWNVSKANEGPASFLMLAHCGC